MKDGEKKREQLIDELASLRQKIERRETLKDAYGIVRTEYGNGATQSNAAGAGRCRSQNQVCDQQYDRAGDVREGPIPAP